MEMSKSTDKGDNIKRRNGKMDEDMGNAKSVKAPSKTMTLSKTQREVLEKMGKGEHLMLCRREKEVILRERGVRHSTFKVLLAFAFIEENRSFPYWSPNHSFYFITPLGIEALKEK
jgi:hypothetical protein